VKNDIENLKETGCKYRDLHRSPETRERETDKVDIFQWSMEKLVAPVITGFIGGGVMLIAAYMFGVFLK
jgi:hypothetical protein